MLKAWPFSFCQHLTVLYRKRTHLLRFTVDPPKESSTRPMVVFAPQKFALLFTLGGELRKRSIKQKKKTFSIHSKTSIQKINIDQHPHLCPKFGAGSLCFLGSFSALRGHSAFLRWRPTAVVQRGGTRLGTRHLLSRSRLIFTVTYATSMARNRGIR